MKFSENTAVDLQYVFKSEHSPQRIERDKNVYMLTVEDTPCVLKMLRVGAVKAYLIGKLLTQEEFNTLLPHLIRPGTGGYYYWHGGNRYFLTQKISGREADYNLTTDLQTVIRTMALFHRLTEKLIVNDPKLWSLIKFNPVQEWQKRLREMEVCRDMAIRLKDNWSRQYLKVWYMFFEEAGKTIMELKNYRFPVKETICYHDWAYHNVIIDRGVALLIDFDYMLVDHPAHDRANLIGRYLRLNQWSTGSLLRILWNFDRFYHWKAGDLKLLRLYLTFPYDYWILGRQYYIEKQPWSYKYYQDQWDRKISNYKRRNSLLDLLKTLERE